jgi:hypothetical protein
MAVGFYVCFQSHLIFHHRARQVSGHSNFCINVDTPSKTAAAESSGAMYRGDLAREPVLLHLTQTHREARTMPTPTQAKQGHSRYEAKSVDSFKSTSWPAVKSRFLGTRNFSADEYTMQSPWGHHACGCFWFCISPFEYLFHRLCSNFTASP